MAEPSLVAAGEEPEERAIEAALRPKNLDDFVGQHRVRKQLSLVLQASRMRGRTWAQRAPSTRTSAGRGRVLYVELMTNP